MINYNSSPFTVRGKGRGVRDWEKGLQSGLGGSCIRRGICGGVAWVVFSVVYDFLFGLFILPLGLFVVRVVGICFYFSPLACLWAFFVYSMCIWLRFLLVLFNIFSYLHIKKKKKKVKTLRVALRPFRSITSFPTVVEVTTPCYLTCLCHGLGFLHVHLAQQWCCVSTFSCFWVISQKNMILCMIMIVCQYRE